MERHGVRSDDDETVYVWAPAVPPPPVAFHAVVVNIKEEVGGSTSSNEGHDDATRSNEGHEQVHVHISGPSHRCQPPPLLAMGATRHRHCQLRTVVPQHILIRIVHISLQND